MTGLLRNDGSFVIFIVQHQYEGKGGWTFSGTAGGFAAKIPMQLRFKDPNTAKAHEPFRSFSACGECWQRTGVHGSFEYEHACRLVQLLQEYNPGHNFRVARLETTQQTTPADSPIPEKELSGCTKWVAAFATHLAKSNPRGTWEALAARYRIPKWGRG